MVDHTMLGSQKNFQKNWTFNLGSRYVLLTWLCMHAQSCPTLCNPMECSPPGSSVHGILQARILEWVAISSSGVFPTQGLNLWLLPCLSHLERPKQIIVTAIVIIKWQWFNNFFLLFLQCHQGKWKLLGAIREGNGNPLQCSCLENPRDRGAWWAAVYGVAQSQIRLTRLSSSSSGGSILRTLRTQNLWG